MADNVSITSGGSTVIATDDVGGVHYQRIKVIDGTADGTAGIPGDAVGLYIQGGVPSGTADSGNPMKIGARAVSFGSDPISVSASARTDLLATRHGVPFVIGGYPNLVTLRTNYTGAQTDAAIVTVGAGTKIAVTQVQVTVDNAVTTTPSIRIGFGTANTPTTVGVVASHPGVAGGGGFTRGDGSGVIGIGADNEDLRCTCTVPTSGSIDVCVSYFTVSG